MSTLYPDLSLTNFPNSIDQFMTFLNIVATDGPLIAQYQSAMEAGNITLANQILTQIPQSTQKIITAVDLNTLSQSMLAVERFYSTDIEPYIDNLQESWINIIQQFEYKGAWQSGTTYITNNLVSYNVNGLNLLYIALSNVPVSTLPTNTLYWRLLTIQGESGESGEGLSYRQEWNSATNYSINDSVTYNGILWMSIQSNQNQIPSNNSQYWKVIMNLEVTTYPIQDTEPSNLEVNSLWFNTSNNPTQYYFLAPLNNLASQNTILNGYSAYDDEGNVIEGNYIAPTLTNVEYGENAGTEINFTLYPICACNIFGSLNNGTLYSVGLLPNSAGGWSGGAVNIIDGSQHSATASGSTNQINSVVIDGNQNLNISLWSAIRIPI